MEDEIKLLFNKSLESLTDSTIAIDNERYNMSVNRSYYAVFYAAKALLLKKGVITKTHAGTIQQFGFEYVVNDNFNEKIVKIFPDLEEFRENSDYDAYFIVKEENAIENLNKAEEFIEDFYKNRQIVMSESLKLINKKKTDLINYECVS